MRSLGPGEMPEVGSGRWVRDEDGSWHHESIYAPGEITARGLPVYNFNHVSTLGGLFRAQYIAATLDLRRRVGRSERAPASVDTDEIMRQINKKLPVAQRKKAKKISIEVTLA